LYCSNNFIYKFQVQIPAVYFIVLAYGSSGANVGTYPRNLVAIFGLPMELWWWCSGQITSLALAV